MLCFAVQLPVVRASPSPEMGLACKAVAVGQGFLPFPETGLSVLGLSCALQKNGRLLVLNPPPEGEGSIRLGELGFFLQLLALYLFSFVGFQTMLS